MTEEVAGNLIRAFRLKCHLNQRELGVLVGYPSSDSVGRHERSEVAPPLLIALAYEAVFEVPVGRIFTGFREVVAQAVVRNAEELRMEVEKERDGKHNFDVQKSQWLARLKQRIEYSPTLRQTRAN